MRKCPGLHSFKLVSAQKKKKKKLEPINVKKTAYMYVRTKMQGTENTQTFSIGTWLRAVEGRGLLSKAGYTLPLTTPSQVCGDSNADAQNVECL